MPRAYDTARHRPPAPSRAPRPALPRVRRSANCELRTPRAAGGFPLTDLAALLAARHAHTALGRVLAQSAWAVDAEMVDDPARVVLRGGEEVAVICPVSGG